MTMTTGHTLSTYESVSDLTGAMLLAARAADWDKLVALEKHCAGLIKQLRAAAGADTGDAATRVRKAQIIRKVLADDAEIRKLTTPRLAQLRGMLASAARSNKLARAYRGTGTTG